MKPNHGCVLIPLLLLSLVPVAVASAAQNRTAAQLLQTSGRRSKISQKQYRAEEIKRELLKIAQQDIASGEGRLTTRASQLLIDLIAGASVRLELDISIREREKAKETLEKAKENMKLFVAELLKEGKRDYYNRIVIDDGTFQAAWKVCPLYPFC